MKGLLEKFV
ncbi:hypothetical protein MXB_3208 [Myxobolus squamalis]|nr:hypothetical protein MXB_3208 [Myxobolus squamalis]